jgi:hypothetical protein
MLESLVIAAILAALGCVALTQLTRPRAAAQDPARPGRDQLSPSQLSPSQLHPAQFSPALVNLAVTRCAPSAAAYYATILDLAARGFLAVRPGRGTGGGPSPGTLHVSLAEPPAGAPALAGYERQVLADMRARLEDTGGAPFEAVAEACTVDVHGTWAPFEAGLRAAAGRQGICRPLLPATRRTALRACAITAVIGPAAFIVDRLAHRSGLGEPGFAAVAAAVLFWVALGWLSRQDRLTAAGAALAARTRRERSALAASAASWDDPAPRTLRQRALAVAAGVPEAVPGARQPAAWRRRRMRSGARRPDGKQRPTEVWSSFSGSWRLVRIESAERLGMASGFALLGGAAWLGLISYAVSIPGGTGPLPAILAGGAVLTAGLGVRRIIMMAAIPRTASFDGQVIARWHEESESENTSSTVSYIAVDDGQRAWTFTGTELFSRVALGDLATVTVNPRSRTLIELTVTGRPRADAVTGREPGAGWPAIDADADPDAAPETDPESETGTGTEARDQPPLLTPPLLSLAEVTSVLGPVLRSTAIPSPGGRGVIHQGQGGTLSVVAAGGAVADLNLRLGRRGTPLSGIGDEAWLLSRGRCVIVRVGAQVAKVTVSGRGAAPAPLDRLAAAIAARLAEQDTRDPAPHPLR